MANAKPPAANSLNLLCLASYEKGSRFLEEAARQGCRVFLLTSESLNGVAKWPREMLEDIFYMPDREKEWNLQHMLFAVCYLARNIRIDRIVPLDDFDLEKAALLREHFRLPGMGESATRYFRDKLAMRMRALERGIPVPEFTSTFNHERVAQFLSTVPGPWVLKPRLMAGAIGIKKFHHHQDVWDRIHSLGDQQSFFVLERFVPGAIFHVDSIWHKGEPVFAIASAYGTPPLDVSHGGGVFTTRVLPRDGAQSSELLALNEKVLKSFDMPDGVSHTEFIRAEADGALYFLETSARVGGAHIADLIQAATGINFWAEWAKLEIAAVTQEPYAVPEPDNYFAGLLVSLAREESPDTSSFSDPEVVWRMQRPHHIGFIVKSKQPERIEELLNEYADRVKRDFHASAPARETVGY
jgi:biotin carboxylase